jgi:hypothetical protein
LIISPLFPDPYLQYIIVNSNIQMIKLFTNIDSDIRYQNILAFLAAGIARAALVFRQVPRMQNVHES